MKYLDLHEKQIVHGSRDVLKKRTCSLYDIIFYHSKSKYIYTTHYIQVY